MTPKKRRDVILASSGMAIAAVCITWALIYGGATPRRFGANTQPGPTAKIEHSLRKGHIVDTAVEPSMAGIKATRVNVDFDDLDATEGFNTLFGAAILNISTDASAGQDADPRLYSLHLTDTPLLEALLELASQAGCEPIEFSTERFRFVNGHNWSGGSWCTSGPFAVAVERIQNAVDLSQEAFAPASASIRFRVMAEPTVKILKYPAAIHIDTFHDDKDQPIIVGETDPVPPPAAQAPCVSFTLPIKLPPNPGRGVSLLRGYVPYTMAVTYESIATKTPDESVTRTLAGLEVQIRPLTRVNATMYSLEVRFRRAGIAPATWSRLAPLLAAQKPQIFNVDNQICPLATAPIPRITDEEFTLLFSIPSTVAKGDPHHISFDFPTDIRDVHVPFEFKDLILP